MPYFAFPAIYKVVNLVLIGLLAYPFVSDLVGQETPATTPATTPAPTPATTPAPTPDGGGTMLFGIGGIPIIVFLILFFMMFMVMMR